MLWQDEKRNRKLNQLLYNEAAMGMELNLWEVYLLRHVFVTLNVWRYLIAAILVLKTIKLFCIQSTVTHIMNVPIPETVVNFRDLQKPPECLCSLLNFFLPPHNCIRIKLHLAGVEQVWSRTEKFFFSLFPKEFSPVKIYVTSFVFARSL